MTGPSDPSGMPPPTPPTTQPPAPPPPPATAPAPPPAAPAAAPGPDIAAAVTGVMAKMTQGEQLAAAGALVILVLSFLVFGVLLNSYGADSVDVLLALGLLGVIWLKASGRYQFSADYRLIVAGLGGALFVLAIVFFLYFLRGLVGPGGINAYSTSGLLGRLVYFAGGILSGVGAWWVWKGR